MMIRKDILPAVSSFGAALCKGLAERKQLGLPYKYEENNARNNCMLSDCLHDACLKLEKDLRDVPAEPVEAMRYCHDILVPDMSRRADPYFLSSLALTALSFRYRSNFFPACSLIKCYSPKLPFHMQKAHISNYFTTS